MEQDWASMLATAIQEARSGLAEGGLPIGAAMFNMKGELLSSGHNRRVQQSDPSAHAETDAFRRAGRLRSYREVVMVTTLAPCWYCSGLVRQFGIRTLVVGESRTFSCLLYTSEPWDCGPGGYQVGGFPPGWAEWNDKFRDTTRKFWIGNAPPSALTETLCASTAIFHHQGRRPWSLSLIHI